MHDHRSHPFQVVVWQEASPGTLLFDKACWIEYARCVTEFRAKEVALCLSLRHKIVAVAKLNEDATRFVNYLYFPDEEVVRQATEKEVH